MLREHVAGGEWAPAVDARSACDRSGHRHLLQNVSGCVTAPAGSKPEIGDLALADLASTLGNPILSSVECGGRGDPRYGADWTAIQVQVGTIRADQVRIGTEQFRSAIAGTRKTGRGWRAVTGALTMTPCSPDGEYSQ
jgi:hypothetical protein